MKPLIKIKPKYMDRLKDLGKPYIPKVRKLKPLKINKYNVLENLDD